MMPTRCSPTQITGQSGTSLGRVVGENNSEDSLEQNVMGPEDTSYTLGSADQKIKMFTFST